MQTMEDYVGEINRMYKRSVIMHISHAKIMWACHFRGSLVLTFDLNHNFRYLVKSILKC